MATHDPAYTAAELSAEARRIASILGPDARVYFQIYNDGIAATMRVDLRAGRRNLSAHGADYPSLIADAERVAREFVENARVRI